MGDDIKAERPEFALWRDRAILSGEIRVDPAGLATISTLALEALPHLEDYVDCWNRYGGDIRQNQGVLGEFHSRAHSLVEWAKTNGLVVPEVPRHLPQTRKLAFKVLIERDAGDLDRSRRIRAELERLIGFAVGYIWSCRDDVSVFPRIDHRPATNFRTAALRLAQLLGSGEEVPAIDALRVNAEAIAKPKRKGRGNGLMTLKVRALLETPEGRAMTSVEIAESFGCSKSLVSKCRAPILEEDREAYRSLLDERAGRSRRRRAR